jgi:hypothetical protein
MAARFRTVLLGLLPPVLGLGGIWLMLKGAWLAALFVPQCSGLRFAQMPDFCRWPIYYTACAYVLLISAVVSIAILIRDLWRRNPPSKTD